MAEKLTIHCFVTGKVQGVWFRAGTQGQAKALGLKGWAKNLSDGRVEVVASGEKDKVQQLYQWLQKGPQLAKVVEVSYEELPWQDFDHFGVL